MKSDNAQNENGLSRRQLLASSGAAIGASMLAKMLPGHSTGGSGNNMNTVTVGEQPVSQSMPLADQKNMIGFVLSHSSSLYRA